MIYELLIILAATLFAGCSGFLAGRWVYRTSGEQRERLVAQEIGRLRRQLAEERRQNSQVRSDRDHRRRRYKQMARNDQKLLPAPLDPQKITEQ